MEGIKTQQNILSVWTTAEDVNKNKRGKRLKEIKVDQEDDTNTK